MLEKQGYDIIRTSRGGDITYHGPGQLVCYPIFNLHRHYLDVHRFLRDLEEAGIQLLKEYGVTGYRVEGRTGIWTDKGKIAALGVHVKKWTTMHGMSFNVLGDLNGFSHIVPCGIDDAGVTSLEEKVKREESLSIVSEKMIRFIKKVFSFDIITIYDGSSPIKLF